LITLTFRPVHGESPVFVRGAYFRICADGTLRGPDNAIAASYGNGLWQLAQRRHRAFECSRPVYLRITRQDGRHEHIGPYDCVRATGGAIFTHETCLGMYAGAGEPAAAPGLWQEVAFLSAEAGGSSSLSA
jgi:hypothetical protein